jgi:hypothetical protein
MPKLLTDIEDIVVKHVDVLIARDTGWQGS